MMDNNEMFTGQTPQSGNIPEYTQQPEYAQQPQQPEYTQQAASAPSYDELIRSGGCIPPNAPEYRGVPQGYSRAQQSGVYGDPMPCAIADCPYRNKSCPPKSGDKAAGILRWIVGVIVGLTVVFGCVLFWKWGLGVMSGRVTAPSGGYSYNTPNGGNNGGQNDDDFFVDPFGGGSDNGSETTPQHKAGLGVTIVELELEFEIDDKYTGGLVISQFSEPSAFDGTGAQVNDMIVAAEGAATPTINQLKTILATKDVGDKLTVTLARYENGVAKTFDVTVTLIPFTSE